MSDKEAENGLVEKLKETLAPQFKQIWTRKKLSTSPYFRNYIKDKLGYIPILQPELDMVFRTKDDKLNAIEVKYLNSTTKGYNIVLTPYKTGQKSENRFVTVKLGKLCQEEKDHSRPRSG